MLSTGDGLAFFSTCAVIIVALLKLAPQRAPLNGKGQHVYRDVCDERYKNVLERVRAGETWMERIESSMNEKIHSIYMAIDEIKKDLKELVRQSR